MTSPDRYVYRAQRQDRSTWWEVVRGYRENGGDVEPGTERPVLRFLPQQTADDIALRLTQAYKDGRLQEEGQDRLQARLVPMVTVIFDSELHSMRDNHEPSDYINWFTKIRDEVLGLLGSAEHQVDDQQNHADEQGREPAVASPVAEHANAEQVGEPDDQRDEREDEQDGAEQPGVP